MLDKLHFQLWDFSSYCIYHIDLFTTDFLKWVGGEVETVSLCSSLDWPATHYIVQACCELMVILLTQASQVLGSELCVTCLAMTIVLLISVSLDVLNLSC